MAHSIRVSLPLAFRLIVRLVVLMGAALAVLLATPLPASADVGPKPDITVAISHEGQPLAYDSFRAAVLSCEDGDRLTLRYADWGMPAVPGLERLDLSDPSGCRWGYPGVPVSAREADGGGVRFSYMVPSRFRLAVYLPMSGQTFLTPPVDRRTLRATFQVDLGADGTATIASGPQPFWETDWRWDLSLVALPLTLGIELLVVLLWTWRLALPARPLVKVSALANVLSLPTVWLVVMIVSNFMGGSSAFVALVAMEVLVVPFEGLLYWRTRKLRLGNALALAAVANLASFTFGAVVH
ncbi:MAG: hypothetical protein ACYC1C_13425 [Chloroflexota bacterium]